MVEHVVTKAKELSYASVRRVLPVRNVKSLVSETSRRDVFYCILLSKLLVSIIHVSTMAFVKPLTIRSISASVQLTLLVNDVK